MISYDLKDYEVYHYDLYRLKSYHDILELGIFENKDSKIKIIEWPELIKQKPKDRIDITFKYLKKDESRDIRILGSGRYKDYKLNEI